MQTVNNQNCYFFIFCFILSAEVLPVSYIHHIRLINLCTSVIHIGGTFTFKYIYLNLILNILSGIKLILFICCFQNDLFQHSSFERPSVEKDMFCS